MAISLINPRRGSTYAGAITFAVALVAASGVSASAAAGDDLLAAVVAATPGTVATAAEVPTNDDRENVISTAVNGVDVVVPLDPGDGIDMGEGNVAVQIGLPFANDASHAVAEADGIVSYRNGNASSSVVILADDGSVQVNTVIEAADAPTEYEHKLTIPEGSSISLDGTGGAVVVDATGIVLMHVGVPWAKDANGSSIPTHYVVKGDSLVQMVDHRSATVAYPVVADPTYYGCLLGGWYPGICAKWTKAETKYAASLVAIAAPAGVVAAYLCDKLPVVYRLGCKVAGSALIANYAYRITSAAAQGKCVRYGFSYPPIVNLFTSLEIVRC